MKIHFSNVKKLILLLFNLDSCHPEDMSNYILFIKNGK